MVIKKVLKVGSSLMIVLPSSDCKAKGIKEGSYVDCDFKFVSHPQEDVIKTEPATLVVKEELISLDKLEEVTFEIGKDVHVEVVEKKLEPEPVEEKKEEVINGEAVQY